jgi:hypothetical protein
MLAPSATTGSPVEKTHVPLARISLRMLSLESFILERPASSVGGNNK